MKIEDILNKIKYYVNNDGLSFYEACDKLRSDISLHEREVYKKRK